MLFSTAVLAMTLAVVGAAQAQGPNDPPPPKEYPFSNMDEAPAPPPLFPPRLGAPLCGANGYAPPIYTTAGDNDGQARGFEQANNCIGLEVRQAAVAVGMGRLEPIGLKAITTVRFTADAVDAAGAKSVVTMYMSYVANAVRVTRDTPDKAGKTARVVQVLTDGKTWDEAQPGIDPRPAKGPTAAEREIWLKLTPYGALWSVIEAEGNTKVIKAGAATVLTGTSPYDAIPVSITLDDKHRPVSVTAKSGKDTYGATFSGYTQKFESDYLNHWPARLVWTKNGKPYLDLTVSEFKSNPYAVFPTQAQLIAAAATKPKDQ